MAISIEDIEQNYPRYKADPDDYWHIDRLIECLAAPLFPTVLADKNQWRVNESIFIKRIGQEEAKYILKLAQRAYPIFEALYSYYAGQNGVHVTSYRAEKPLGAGRGLFLSDWYDKDSFIANFGKGIEEGRYFRVRYLGEDMQKQLDDDVSRLEASLIRINKLTQTILDQA